MRIIKDVGIVLIALDALDALIALIALIVLIALIALDALVAINALIALDAINALIAPSAFGALIALNALIVMIALNALIVMLALIVLIALINYKELKMQTKSLKMNLMLATLLGVSLFITSRCEALELTVFAEKCNTFYFSVCDQGLLWDVNLRHVFNEKHPGTSGWQFPVELGHSSHWDGSADLKGIDEKQTGRAGYFKAGIGYRFF